MTLQDDVAAFLDARDLRAAPGTRLLDLVSETGELAKEALKATGYGKSAWSAPAGWREELGDAGFSLIALAAETGVDFEAAVRAALDKYAARLTKTGDAGSGS